MFSIFTKKDSQKDLYFQIKSELSYNNRDYGIKDGWYAIFKENICLYVGQSKNLSSRIATHLNGKYSNCDTILIYLNIAEHEDLDLTEQFLMNILKPTENLLVDFTKNISIEEIAECDIMYAFENPNLKELKADEKVIRSSSFNLQNSSNHMIITDNLHCGFSENQINVINSIKKV
jgi:hypothetical protein